MKPKKVTEFDLNQRHAGGGFGGKFEMEQGKTSPHGADSAQILSLSLASLFWPDGHPR